MFDQFIYNYPFLQTEFFGNTTFQWIYAMVIFFLSLAALKIIKMLLIVRLKEISKKTKTEIDDIIIGGLNAIHWPFYVFVSFYIALQFLKLHQFIERAAYYIFIIAVVYYAIKVAEQFIDFTIKKFIAKKVEADEHDVAFIKVLGVIVKVVLWAGALVLILSNLGYNVTSLIAGLGIGGIAIALALQNILGDLFSSFAIYFDKPFKVGDFIIIGEIMGTVKKVGIKTTRIESLGGEEIVMANNELTKAQIRNYGVMERRRIVFKVGVTYDTPAEKLNRIPQMISKLIKGQDNVTLDRVHFQAFGDSSLIYEVVYYVESGDYNQYMDIQQAINLAIVNKFAEEKIEIAFPTQTVYLKKE